MIAETKSTKTANDVEIPSEWKIITLKDACIKIQDGNYGGDYPKQDEFFESGIPFLTSKAIGGEGEIIDKKIDFISEEKHLQLKKAQLKLNDVLFTNRGANVGTIGLVDERIAHGNIGPQLTLLRANSARINFLFLKEVMKSHFVQNQVRSQDSGSAMNFFGIGDTSKFKIPLPPLPEQKAIAQVLSTADAAIHTTEKLIAQKELRKKWLMQQLLTGKKRLKGFGGEWLTLKIKNIGIVPEKKPITKVDNQKLLTVKLHTKGIEFNERDKPVISSTGRPYYERNEGEILIGRQNIHNGGIGFVTKEFDGHICSNAISSFKVNDNHSTTYLLFYLQYPSNYHRIEDYMGGTGQKELSEKQFLDIPIKLPKSKEEQTAIAQVLQAADKEISLLKAKADKLREQKKGLMQQLLTGKVRLKIK